VQSEGACPASHLKGVTGVAFAPNGALAASAGADGVVWLHSGHDEREAVARLVGAHDAVRGGVVSVAFSADSRLLLSAGADGYRI
jgi:WD40 repeat protein